MSCEGFFERFRLLSSLPLSSSESSLIPNSFLSLSVRLSGFSLLGVSVDLRLMRSDELLN